MHVGAKAGSAGLSYRLMYDCSSSHEYEKKREVWLTVVCTYVGLPLISIPLATPGAAMSRLLRRRCGHSVSYVRGCFSNEVEYGNVFVCLFACRQLECGVCLERSVRPGVLNGAWYAK